MPENSSIENVEDERTLLGVPKETWVIFSINTINSFGFSATFPFLAVYLLRVRYVPLSEIGVVYLATGVFGIASQVISGRLTDTIGPKKVMLFGYASSLLSSLFLGYLVFVNSPVYYFFVAYPIFSLFRGISRPATAAIIASQKARQVRTGFSLQAIGGNLGFAIGPAIGGPMIDLTSYASVFLVSAGAAGAAALVAIIWIKDRKQLAVALRATSQVMRWLSWKSDRNLIILFGLLFCMFLSIGYEITPLSVYVADIFHFSNSALGYLFATNGLLIVILQIPLTRLTERPKRILLPLVLSSAFAVVSFLIATVARTFLEWELFMITITLAEILLTVPSQSIVAFFSKAGNRGTYQGYYSAVSNAGRSLASFIGPTSFAFFALDPPLSWVTVAIFALATGIGLAILSPSIQRDFEKQVPH